jgi:hypothetical protein
MAATGLSKRCVQRWCRWLEERGLLAVLEPGTTPQFRPAILALGTGNLAREWQLAAAVVERSCTPPLPGDLDKSPPQARANQNPEKARRCAADSLATSSPPRLPTWPLRQNPQRRSEALAAAARLRADLPVLRALPAAAVRSAVRAYFAAGWTVADVEYALDHRPDGTAYRHTHQVRVPGRWLAWRLARWLDADGALLRPVSQLRAKADRIRIAEQAGQRAYFAADRGATVDSTAPAARARQILAAASPAAARVIALAAARKEQRP